MDANIIWDAIQRERARQHEKWSTPHLWGVGDCSDPHIAEAVKVAVLVEECGEVSRAVLDHNPDVLRQELIQIAAVAVAWLEGDAQWMS